MQESGPARSSALDLDLLEIDAAPIFVVKVEASAVPFDFVYANEAFRRTGLRDSVLGASKEALLFRSWAQAWGNHGDLQQQFAGRIWSSSVHGRHSTFKTVRAIAFTSGKEGQNKDHVPSPFPIENSERLAAPQSLVHKRSREELRRSKPGLLQTLPRTNLDARWEGIQTMMEMSDVGVFEYNATGKLLHANEAWYRLSSHPRDLPAHVQFSFMDLVYPEDQALVLSMWNTLAQGSPVTFEMRWKPRDATNDAAQWVLSACVPIFDDDRKLIKVAQARVDALEQARVSELKFARFAQLSPTAIYIFVPESGMQFVNDQFFELTGQICAPMDQFDWVSVIADEDAERFEEDWKAMLQGKRSDGVQFRLKKTWVNQDGIKSNIWVQSTSYPQLDAHGKVISIMGTLFDISQFKWAESVQRRRVEEALEAKRQQENFIDMTSHELRNPLSAVVQCAESVRATLDQLPIHSSTNSPTDHGLVDVQEEIATSIDALQTIVSCSLHQKRVIDDVLTLSKLDSKLILITPIRVQPTAIVADALKMFDVECRQMNIDLSFVEDDSIKGFDWVMLDPSRLLQVLINLLTNAIKFTKDQPERCITVKLGGSWSHPPPIWESISFAEGDDSREKILDQPDWGNGKKGYLWVKVTDTGCGMTQDEQIKLFSRFTQATPRTHVKYGGSGLGLFISKSLTTLQGGAIGVSSDNGKGSTFAFFVSTRRAHGPAKKGSERHDTSRPLSRRTMSSEAAMKAIKLHVLIVEDNLVNQKVLMKQLQKFGWTISVVGDGTEALNWLQRSIYWRSDCETVEASAANGRPADVDYAHVGEPLDVILMDVEMPKMDGLTCARHIREYEEKGVLALPPITPAPQTQTATPSVSPITSLNLDPSLPSTQTYRLRLPILAVSANARMEQIKQALAAGMDDAISKPFRIPELWPKIRGLIPRLAQF
ncbi:hypothetical protein EK21DRAFT_100980 [Setomelanomma holmii]|uniref:Uncharacterized protein n=1 Tax=Setomelanomma holmii TaxID=210430 RepID=A0A9P4LM09_9PLEO|nr:hypothetical protein EK21DRAFT_100980 [Setomelanomma holmii]